MSTKKYGILVPCLFVGNLFSLTDEKHGGDGMSGYAKLIGKQIAKVRKMKRLTQAQLAEAVDVTNETISRLERGISVPSLQTIEKISQALGVPLKDLFNFDNDFAIKTSPPMAKMMALLRLKKEKEIDLAYSILKEVFKSFKKIR